MAKMTIDEQVAAAETKLRELKRKQHEQHVARKARRYDIIVAAVPSIDDIEDDELAKVMRNTVDAAHRNDTYQDGEQSEGKA